MTLTGRAALLALAAVVVVFVAPLGGLMVGYVAAAIALAIVADVTLAASARSVAMRRDVPASTRLGDSVDVTLTLENLGSRRLRGWVRDGWPPSAHPHPRLHRVDLGPRAQARVLTTLVPSRRGRRDAAGVTIRSVGPLGVAGRQRTRSAPASVQVLPAFASRRFLPEKVARLRELDGAVAIRTRGQGTEFDSLREYVVGDDPRSIDWRATARSQQVVVRTWRPERDRQLLLVLDSGRTSAARIDDAPRFDTYLDATLLLTALARRAGDRVAVLVHDSRLRVTVDAGRSGNPLSAIVQATASVEANLVETDMTAVVAQALRQLRGRALVVLFTTVEPAVVRDGLLPAIGALARRHTVVVASASDPAVDRMRADHSSVSAVYSAAAAETATAERDDVVTALRRRGVDVVQGPPEIFASRVADTYLDLKAAGRL